MATICRAVRYAGALASRHDVPAWQWLHSTPRATLKERSTSWPGETDTWPAEAGIPTTAR